MGGRRSVTAAASPFPIVRRPSPQAAVAALSCLLLLCLLSSGCAPLGGSAQCGQVAPSAEPSRTAPGETFRLHGGGFAEGCNDTGPPFLEEPARRDIRVEMRQGGGRGPWPRGSRPATPPTTPSTSS